jgi:hypothetical protein
MNIQELTLISVRVIKDAELYFAEELYKSMKVFKKPYV